MGWTKSIKKTAKKTTKAVKKTANTVVNTTTDIAEDAWSAAEDVAGWMVDSAEGLSKEAQQLADDCIKVLEEIGDLALAILNDVFLAALEAFVDQILKDYTNAIDATVTAVKALIEDPSAALEIIDVIEALIADPKDESKNLFVDATRLSTMPSYVAAAEASGFKSVSAGIQVSAGETGGASGVAADSDHLDKAYAGSRDGEDVDMAIYAGVGVSRGTASGGGGSAGVELGAWRDKPRNLAGACLGVSVGASYEVGLSVELYISTDITSFLGFNVVPQTGTSVDFNVIEGRTTVLATF